MEQLFRVVPDIKRIYVIIRSKRGLSGEHQPLIKCHFRYSQWILVSHLSILAPNWHGRPFVLCGTIRCGP